MTPATQARAWLFELLAAARFDDDAVLTDACIRVAHEVTGSDQPDAACLLLALLSVAAGEAYSEVIDTTFDGNLTAAVDDLVKGLT